MNICTVIAFPDRCQSSAGRYEAERGPPMKTIQLEMSAALADRLVIVAGYSCKSPGQWARDALSAVLDMEQTG